MKFKNPNINKALSLIKYVAPYKGVYIFGMVMLLFSSLSTLSFSLLLGEITSVLESKSAYTLNQVVIVFAVALVAQSIFSYFRIYSFSYVVEKGTADLRNDSFKKMITSPIFFFEKNRVGDLMSRLTSDISSVQSILTTTIAEFLRQIIMVVAGTAILFYISWELTIFMLCTFPITVIAAVLFGRIVRKTSKQVQAKLAETNVVVDESLQSINTVKAYTNERLEQNRYSTLLNEVVGLSLKLARYRGILLSFLLIGVFGGICLVVWYAGNLILKGELELSGLMSFLLTSMMIATSAAGLGDIYTSIQRTLGASERLMEILDEPSELDIDLEHPHVKLQGNIAFQNVNFHYPSREEITVIKNLSFDIKAGEKVAFVGHSGAGKSTVVQLLMKFYQVQSGVISLDNTNINDLDVSSLRENIAIVPQEVLLFGGSIYDNIAYGKPSATAEEIKLAAKKANAMEFIEKFPEGFSTIVGERGIKLSGGQKQRIAIARAILKDPSILVLDEATSALDSQSEALVQEALEELMKNRTSIIIAHRLATIKHVDRIYVMKDGEIKETGTHQSLLSTVDGLYSKFVQLQTDMFLK